VARRLRLLTVQELVEVRFGARQLEERHEAFERGVDEVFGQAIHELQDWNHQLDERIRPTERLVWSSRALPGMADLELERFDADSVGSVLGFSDSERALCRVVGRVDPLDFAERPQGVVFV
jgi:hypothetical protein